MADRISTLDIGYENGDLSVYPEAIDDKDTLYEVKNNAETKLTQALPSGGKFVVVTDTSKFPDKGLIRVGDELIYYAEKATGLFKDLKRGFAGSVVKQWSKDTAVKNAVMAEHHNAVKDAILNIEEYVGLSSSPATTSLHGRIIEAERKLLAPKALFRGFPKIGPSPLQVTFQNFCNDASNATFLWDFGDGTVSTDTTPVHTYLAEGDYTVRLYIVTQLGAQGVTTKNAYIKVRDDEGLSFMYVTPELGTTSTTFTFVDQTDGDILERHWNFGDGTKSTIDDPNIHTAQHTYTKAGSYDPTLLVVFSDQRVFRLNLSDSIVVTA